MPIALAYSKSLTGLQTIDVRVEADLPKDSGRFDLAIGLRRALDPPDALALE